MVVCAPKDGNELRDLLWTGVQYTAGPFALRYPRENVPASYDPRRPMRAIPIGSWEVLAEGSRVVLLAAGTMVETALEVREILARRNIAAGVVNARFVKPLDEAMLADLAKRYPAVVTIEENTLAGGFGDAVYEACQRARIAFSVMHHMGLPDRFVEHGSREELLAELGLTAAQIADTVAAVLADAPVPPSAPHSQRTGSGEGWLD
jgi:1-deoxy-D-xylulose-5-phosphate synthase